jgi:hypothetical protein
VAFERIFNGVFRCSTAKSDNVVQATQVFDGLEIHSNLVDFIHDFEKMVPIWRHCG